MSYDLVVFDPRGNLRDRNRFLQWFESRSQWVDALDYNQPCNAPAALQRWYRDMIVIFPPMYGPYRASERHTRAEWTSDYGIGTDLIHAAFNPAKASLARETAYRLAAQHAVGLYEVSTAGTVWFPRAGGTLEFVHGAEPIPPPSRGAHAPG